MKDEIREEMIGFHGKEIVEEAERVGDFLEVTLGFKELENELDNLGEDIARIMEGADLAEQYQVLGAALSVCASDLCLASIKHHDDIPEEFRDDLERVLKRLAGIMAGCRRMMEDAQAMSTSEVESA